VSRRGYLDWLRGAGVLIMIEAHVLDAWTRVADRSSFAYRWSIVLGGFGAPIFLFLAGMALALAAGSRLRGGMGRAEVGALARKRGLQILGLALLFRLQSWVISGGALERTLLKVDILNVMGPAIVLAAALWQLGRGRRSQAVLLGAVAVAAAMLTPVIRGTPLLDALLDPVEWYLRPPSGHATFALFPWAGFVLAGGAIGTWLDAARTDRDERQVLQLLTPLGLALAIGGYAASFLPAIYPQTDFWTSSPTFFFLRLGVLIVALPLAHAWNLRPGRSLLREFGVASLFVYWIHVEMVYGVVSSPLHRQLTFPQAVAGCAVLSLCLLGLVKLRDQIMSANATMDAKVFEDTTRIPQNSIG
jgi:uncharacterized membrane protein